MANPDYSAIVAARARAKLIVEEISNDDQGEDSPYLVVLKVMMKSSPKTEIERVIARLPHHYSFTSAAVTAPRHLVAWHDCLQQHQATGTFLKNIEAVLGIPRTRMAAFLDVTPKTLRTWATAKRKLPSADTEKLARLSRVLTAANLVFEDPKYAREWMEAPSEALGNRVPFDLLSSGDGERLVLDELGRIEHGLPV